MRALDRSAAENRELVGLAQAELDMMAQAARQTLGMSRESKNPLLIDVRAMAAELFEFYLRKSGFRSMSVRQDIRTDETINAFPPIFGR